MQLISEILSEGDGLGCSLLVFSVSNQETNSGWVHVDNFMDSLVCMGKLHITRNHFSHRLHVSKIRAPDSKRTDAHQWSIALARLFFRGSTKDFVYHLEVSRPGKHTKGLSGCISYIEGSALYPLSVGWCKIEQVESRRSLKSDFSFVTFENRPNNTRS